MARWTDVVDRGIDCLNAGLADVADLEPALSTLVRSRHRAAAAAEISFPALGSGFSEARRAAVVAGRALRAFADIAQIFHVAVRAVGAQELRTNLRARRAVAACWTVNWVTRVEWAVETFWATLAGLLSKAFFVLEGTCATLQRGWAALRAVRSSRTNGVVCERPSAGRAVVAGLTQAYSVHGAAERAIVPTSAWRTVGDVDQALRRRVRAGGTHYRCRASFRAVVTGWADVVDCGVQRLHTGFADVADLETTCAALMRSRHRAATTAEVALSALGGRFGEPFLSAVEARRALRALRDVLEAVAGTIGTVGAQELRRVTGSLWAVAARRASHWRGGIVQAIRTRRAYLADTLVDLILIETGFADCWFRTSRRAATSRGTD